MVVSVVRKLERCEITRATSTRQGEAIIENYHVFKYKMKIKDFSSSPNKLDMMHEFQESLSHVMPNYELDVTANNTRPQVQAPPHLESSPLPNSGAPSCTPLCITLQQIASQHQERLGSARLPLKLQQHLYQKEDNSSSPSSPCMLHHNLEQHAKADYSSCGNSSLQQSQIIEERENLMTSPCQQLQPTLENTEESTSLGLKSACKVQENLQEQKNLDEACLEGMSQLCKLQDSNLQEEEDRSWTRSPWKLQKKAGKPWEVKKIECECCGMEEECTKGYEERVRGELCGHWLCGLCGEAVREERKRLGGAGGVSMQAALVAHMQPCRRFSSQARSKDSPPASDVAVPHAVCRLLRRHLSTPSPSPRCSPSLSRSSSCLPKP